MADSVLPYIYLGLSAVSLGVSIYSSIESSDAASDAASNARKQAAMSEMNAYQKALAENQNEELRRRRVLSSQRAIYGTSGVEMEGSPLLVQAETEKLSDINLSRIAMGLNMETASAYQYGKYQSDLAESKGNMAVASGVASGVNTVQNTYKVGKEYDWW